MKITEFSAYSPVATHVINISLLNRVFD